jgi:tetratricopeptide (TPR) repeat protein
MQSDRWLQVKGVIADVLDVAPADRVALLDTACSHDPELRSTLNGLLPPGAALRRLFEVPMAPTLATIVRAGGVVDRPLDASLLAAGTRIGPYEILRLLGAGGMGQVYLARDTRLERVVALKRVVRGVAADPVARARVLREARAAGSLTHPGIAQVYDVIEDSGALVIVMEYVEGMSLRDRLSQGPFGVAESIRICLTVADALGHAHAAGVVHCDIKPANMQLLPAGGVKILDFGIARRFAARPSQTTEAQGGVAGTPGYMSPEQALGRPLDQRSDLFSLGVVLFEMLAGERAFDAGGGPRWFDAVYALLGNTPDYSRLGPNAPAALREVITRVLQWDPAARYQDAAEFQQALNAVLHAVDAVDELDDVEPTPVPVPTPPQPPGPSRRAVVGAVVALLAVVGLGGAAWRVGWAKDPLVIDARARQWYSDGVAALQEGAYLQASRLLERVHQIDPEYAMSWARLGEAQLELDQERRAQQSVLEATSLVPDRSRLPDDQRLALEAAMGMARRDHPAALRAYATLVSRNPKSAPLQVDLGRVHEAMGAVPKAVESYRQAGQLDAENPAPFLRMGILYGRAGDTAASEAAFKRAEELYTARGRVEGVATVSLERGVMLDRAQRGAEAVASLQRALQLAASVDSSYLRAAALFKLSSIAGYAGRIEEAERHAREALRLGEEFEGLKAFGLVDLGNAFVYRKQLKTAEQHFRQAVDISVRAAASRSEARARLSLAALLVRVGSVTEAMAEAKAAFDYYNQTGFVVQRSRALTVLAQGQERTGDLAGAQASYEALLKTAVDSGQQGQIAQQHDSISTVLLQREQYVAALRHSDESLTRFRTLKAPYDVMHRTLIHADILCRLGRLDDADRALEAMFRPDSGMSKPTPADEHGRALRRARVLLARNENARAAAIARTSLARASDVSGVTRAALQRALVLALARSGRAAEALSQLDAAKDSADESTYPVARAQTALARSEVLLRLRRYEETLADAGPLAEQFAAAERHESAWVAARLATQAATALGQVAVAARWQAMADDERARFIAQFDANALRIYEARRDVRGRL